MPLTARFQLVENALNDLHQVTFCNITAFSTDKYGKISDFIVSLSSTSYMRGVFTLVLQHKDNKLLSICRDFKSLDDFNDTMVVSDKNNKYGKYTME